MISVVVVFSVSLVLNVRNFDLSHSEGFCVFDRDCSFANSSCIGEYSVCTNNLEKYENLSAGVCEIVPDFPSNKGYQCECLQTLARCGWAK